MQHSDIETETTWDDPDVEGKPSRRRRGWLWGFVATLAVLALAYVGGAYYLSTKVPTNAVVGGGDVGGTTPEEAKRRVESQVAIIESEPVAVTLADTGFDLEPDRAGLRIDTDATLAGITRFTLDPRALYDHVSGSFERDFVLDVDEEAVGKAVAAGAESIHKEAVEGTVEFVDGALAMVQPEEGLALDVEETTERVIDAWPFNTEVEGAGGPVEPQTPATVFDAFARDFADKAIAGPLTVQVGEQAFEIPTERFVPLLSATVGEGTITPAIDAEALAPLVEELGAEAGVLREARDARVRFEGTEASVEPSQTGVDVSVEGQEEAVLAALATAERVVSLEPVITQPTLTTEKARETLPRERISSFTSQYSPAPRAQNIKIAARAMNGTYIPPGGSFSLNEVLGQRTPERGYVQAGTIVNNRIVDNYGGGVSQVSTTVYNAAYFAGVQIDEFHPHSFFIQRYPEGREATLSWGSIDNRWTNNTRGGILLRSWADDYAITVELWGIKTFDVESVKGPRRNIVPPDTIVDDSPKCVPQIPQPGFDVTVTRIISQGGNVVKREPVHTHYVPQDKVTCTHPGAG